MCNVKQILATSNIAERLSNTAKVVESDLRGQKNPVNIEEPPLPKVYHLMWNKKTVTEVIDSDL